MMSNKLAAVFLALALVATACGDDGGNADPGICDGVSTCTVEGLSCSGDSLNTCAPDADGCLIETAEDCSAGGQQCVDLGAGPVCGISECSDDAACSGAADGDSFCDGDGAVACALGADGCLDATTVDCAASGDVCEDASGVAECAASCADHPLCVGAADGDTACDGYFLNACTAGADGCLDFSQVSCGAALCEDATPPAACGVQAATGLDCANAIPVAASGFVLAGTNFVADFAGGTNLTDGTCGDTADVGTVGVVLSVALLAGETVQVTETSAIDVVFSLQRTTCALDGVCDDTADLGNVGELTGLSFTAAQDETVFLTVENFDLAPANSAYSIEVFINPACGNSLLDPGETCDDGGLVTGDGCNELCEAEFGFGCDGLSPSTCSGLTSLGSYGRGETVPPLVSNAAATAGTVDQFLITFTESVFVGGTLAANGTGDYDFLLSDVDGLVAISDAVGDEVFPQLTGATLIPAGTYLVEVELFGGDADSDLGYALNLNTGAAATVLANGGVGAVTGTGLSTDDFESAVFTLSENLDLVGTLTGTGGADFDLFIIGADELLTFSNDDLDEAFNISLQAGTYYFIINTFSGAAADYSLDFTATTSALPDIGTFAAAAVIADTVGGAMTAREYDHYTITFSEDVLLSGTLGGNTTGDVNLSIYNAAIRPVRLTAASFTDQLVPAGTYIVSVQSRSAANGGGDVDAYTLTLSSIAVPVI